MKASLPRCVILVQRSIVGRINYTMQHTYWWPSDAVQHTTKTSATDINQFEFLTSNKLNGPTQQIHFAVCCLLTKPPKTNQYRTRSQTQPMLHALRIWIRRVLVMVKFVCVASIMATSSILFVVPSNVASLLQNLLKSIIILYFYKFIFACIVLCGKFYVHVEEKHGRHRGDKTAILTSHLFSWYSHLAAAVRVTWLIEKYRSHLAACIVRSQMARNS